MELILVHDDFINRVRLWKYDGSDNSIVNYNAYPSAMGVQQHRRSWPELSRTFHVSSDDPDGYFRVHRRSLVLEPFWALPGAAAVTPPAWEKRTFPELASSFRDTFRSSKRTPCPLE